MQIEEKNHSVFVALRLPTPTIDLDCHVTIAHACNVTQEEIAAIRRDFDLKIRPFFPIQLEICNFRMRGADSSIPTYDVAFSDFEVDAACRQFYSDHYKAEPGKRRFPKLEPHVTVDTPQKLNYVESIRSVTTNEIIFDVHNDGNDAIYDQKKWQCSMCQMWNSINQKECSRIGCSQWRPQQAIPRKPGDWECCGQINFASKDACFKCRRPKESSSASAPSIYEIPPARIVSMDWKCACGDVVFASRSNCRKCGRGKQ